ncbi:equilibrative nucleoside transporter 4 [Bombina bombina]|uniref:equilibrative nucleoside transporter 4 n=1 Tax=Bombina bombina TaxID=8345 RepID=UPI00235A5C36|nr:equilibrative nucleoside transporter 4 [Bombina bombina]
MYKHFIDDLLLIWCGPEHLIVDFVGYLNNNDMVLRFTFEYNSKSINFLNVTLKGNEDGTIDSSVYRKPISGNTLLHANSSHPEHVRYAVTKGQFARLKRNCSNPSDYSMAADDLERRLQERKYSKRDIGRARKEVNDVDRHTLITENESRDNPSQTQGVYFVTGYSSQYTKICAIFKKHFALLSANDGLQEVVKKGLRCSYRKSHTLGSRLAPTQLKQIGSSTSSWLKHPGYLLALGPLLFVGICDVWLELFTFHQSYAINLVAVGVVAFGCTVQQSSFYGYTGMLPKRYTQGVMTGESTAGVVISLSRIFTKLLLPSEKESTIIFFFISISLELMCFVLHLLVKRTRFVEYYTARTQGRATHVKEGQAEQSFGYRVHHNTLAEDVRLDNGGTSPPNSQELQSDVAGGGAYVRFDVPVAKVKRSWPSFRDMMLQRYLVLRVIWAYMLSIAVTYFITLCLFPGLESEIRNCTLGEWLPILIMAIFNLSDFVGKILAALPYDWHGSHLLICSSIRVVFIPLFIMCVYPSGKPTFSHPAWPCIFSLLMGISNGYFGSVPMILAAGQVSPDQRELAGNTMTVSYMTGLTLGSSVAYAAYSLASTSHIICLHTETYNSSLTPHD